MSRLIPGLTRFLDNDGDPLAGGKLEFFETGSTTTNKDTYSDIGESSANANPVILDSNGLLETDIFGSGSYNVRLYNSNDVLIDEADPIGATSTNQLDDWNSLITYSNTDVVTGSNGNYYRSIASSNIGNDPTTDATKWSQIEFLGYWNTNETYSTGDFVRDSDGYVYVSQANSNAGNTPSTDSTNWSQIGCVTYYNATQTYIAGDVVRDSDGYIYVSQAGSNTGNTPSSDTTNWSQIGCVTYYNSTQTYASGDIVRDSDGFIYVSQSGSNTGNTPSTSPTYWLRNETTNNITKTQADSPVAVTAAQCRQGNIVFNNTGASGAVNFTLPAAAVGYKIGGYVDNAQYLRMTANGSDVFATSTQTSASGGYIRSNAGGTYWRIECFETSRWTITELNDILLYDE